jgi:DNA-binding NtrC family response regulator
MRHEAFVVGLIEDDPVMGGSIVQRLEIEGCSVHWWKSGAAALAASHSALPELDIVVCDIRLPDMNGEDVFRKLLAGKDAPPFLFITGFGEIDHAVRLMRMGAADYMTKPFRFEDFLGRIRENVRIDRHATPGQAVLGISEAMRSAENLVRRYAVTDLPVLITGETGVGKEVTARLLHETSSRVSMPFIAVNCAAIPGELLESELFGHEKGAFTSAQGQHLGYAERAGGGTLFLDEIGDMPAAMQAKLLRLIEDRHFFRIGGERPVPFRARIVSATHRDLGGGHPAHGFRGDLYFRLAVLPVSLKPLRERPEDIPWLMDRLLAEACARQDRKARGFSTIAEETALAYSWPGNVREMKNRIERAVALGSGDWIMPGDLFPDMNDKPGDASPFVTLAATRDRAERRQIERALKRTSGQIQAAAKLLGVSRTTLWEKMVRLGLRGE